MKKIVNGNYIYILLALLVLLVYSFFKLVTVDRPRGLKVSGIAPVQDAPAVSHIEDLQAFIAKTVPQKFFANIGLDYDKQEEEKVVEKPVIKKAEPKVVAKKPVINEPKIIDLERHGYRLKGIILEEGKTTAFIFDPKSKRVEVVREFASQPIQILEAGQRAIKIQTVDGVGVLELEAAKTVNGGNASTFNSGVMLNSAASTRTYIYNPKNPENKIIVSEPKSGEPVATPPSRDFKGVSEDISAGNLMIKRGRHGFGLMIKAEPKTFDGFDLKPGDQIIGTSQNSFRSPRDVIGKIRELKPETAKLKVIRGKETIFIQKKADTNSRTR
jgi:hypothetical protein